MPLFSFSIAYKKLLELVLRNRLDSRWSNKKRYLLVTMETIFLIGSFRDLKFGMEVALELHYEVAGTNIFIFNLNVTVESSIIAIVKGLKRPCDKSQESN